MNTRRVKIFNGKKFDVPQNIQRIDSRGTHGWQLRYGNVPTQFFADGSNDGSGAAAALAAATEALHKRVRRMPAPNGLRSAPSKRKKSGLPLGISGPYEVHKPTRKTPYYTFQVSVPLMSGGSTTRRVYIGTANTMTAERFDEALAKAILMRDSAVEKFKLAKSRAMRQAIGVGA